MRKYRLVITIPDDTYPVESLREMIESEGLVIESMYDIAPVPGFPEAPRN